MIVLIDTDVLLDLALDRKPHADGAAALVDALARRSADAFVAWHSVSNFYYLVTPTHGRTAAKAFVLDLVEFTEVAPTTTESLRIAARLPMKDFEDAMQVAAALACSADLIATRNTRDFANSPVKALSPAAVVKQLSENI